jgi:hypothetical protein
MSDRRQRDARHPVDRGAQLVVGDPRELVADDDVADREQAPRLDSCLLYHLTLPTTERV